MKYGLKRNPLYWPMQETIKEFFWIIASTAC